MSKAPQTYNNTLSPIAKTRIMADRNLVKKDEKGYAESDIYFSFDENQLNNEFKILTIGSREIHNPYFGGFFMFYGKFPDQYPFTPPHILAKTQGLNTRFHPNYYVNGKCCLSILGTWSGPPWTSCQNLGTTSQALKSLFIDNPITQEPGWENCLEEKSNMYNFVISYRTLEVAVLNMLDTPPLGFECFKDKMERTFLQLYNKYIEKLEDLKKYEGKSYKSPLYDIKININTSELEKRFKLKYTELSKKYDIQTESIKPKKTPIKPVYKRKAPDEKASCFDVGYKMQSLNGDKDWWIVYETKNGQKRWKKV
uniref:Ubiquitin-conjugating enzyme E2 Z n=1 Tax=viral metagenome TaxID=1070528 RepID=A0A6C0IVG1_9ZZZZ